MELSTLQPASATARPRNCLGNVEISLTCAIEAMVGSTATIFVVDYQERLVKNLRRAFGLMRFQTVNPDAPETAQVQELRPSCLILGPSVPILKGAQLCARFRGTASLRGVPILVIGSGSADEKTIALSAGASDYISHHATPEEIVTSVIVALKTLVNTIPAPWRRPEQEMRTTEAITFGDLILPENSYSVIIHGRAVSLTSAEFQILRKLMKSAGEVVSVDSLRRIRIGVEESMLMSPKSRICSLRRKLRTSRVHIHTVRNAGYFLSDSN